MNPKEKSPFTPGNPVPSEFFVGRIGQIQEILRYVQQIKFGKQENIFLIGDGGIGKSSLASYLCSYVDTREKILGLHAFLGRVSTLEEMVRHIFDQLLQKTKGQIWFEKIAAFFGKHIKELGLFGVSVSFAPPDQDLRELTRRFPEALNNVLERIKGEKAGLFIALDDINGLVGKEEFANWYKSFADEIAVRYKDFPVLIMLIGLPEKRGILSKLQPSLMRVFRVVGIEKLSDEEVKQFLSRAFEEAHMKVKPEAMEFMVRFSSGLPILMHEIGDATFWADADGVIDEKDALRGVLTAAQKVGEKYLDPRVYKAIRSQRYRAILRKLGEVRLSRNFTKREVETRLNENEKKVFHNFLRRIRELGVIEPDREKGLGAYKFVNEIYPIYIWMESERFKRGARE